MWGNGGRKMKWNKAELIDTIRRHFAFNVAPQGGRKDSQQFVRLLVRILTKKWPTKSEQVGNASLALV